MRMEWPSSIADGDAVIVREETPDGLRFVVHSRREPQFACGTYAEAEARTLAYTDHARAHAWYTDGHTFQLLDRSARPPLSPTRRRVSAAPTRSV